MRFDPSIECFHSRGQHLCKFIGTKQSVCIRKEFNSHRQTAVIQLTLTLKMTTAQVVETSVTVNNNWTVLFRTTFTRTIKLNLLLKCSIYYINTNEIPNLFNLIVLFAVKGAIYCVAIVTVIFSPLKISCFPVKAHLDFLI